MIFKVGDLVTIDDSIGIVQRRYNHEIGRVYIVTKVFNDSVIEINHDKLREKNRNPKYWKLAKNQIVIDILKDL